MYLGMVDVYVSEQVSIRVLGKVNSNSCTCTLLWVCIKPAVGNPEPETLITLARALEYRPVLMSYKCKHREKQMLVLKILDT